MIRSTRRSFIKSVGVAGIVFPTILPSKIFGENAPSKNINVALIGCGERSITHFQGYRKAKNCRMVGVCDPKSWMAKDRANNINELNKDNKCKIYANHLEAFDDPEVDAVSISTHDFWHVPMAIAALKKGKHVYLEKTLSLNLNWSKRLRDVLAKSGKTFQFGTQMRSSVYFRKAVEFVRNGYIGNIKECYVTTPTMDSQLEETRKLSDKQSAIPDGFDYDLWQGVAKERPYSDRRVSQYGGYHIYDYGLGFMGNWGIHPIDIVQWGLNMDNSSPIRCEGEGSFLSGDDMFDTVRSWNIEYTYDNGVKLKFVPDKVAPKLADKNIKNIRQALIFFDGDEGWLSAGRGQLMFSDEKMKRVKLKDSDWKVTTDLKESHFGNFISCCISGKETIAPFEAAFHSDSLAQMSNAVVRSKKSLEWDLKKEEPKDADQLKIMTCREMRDKWSV